MNRRELLRLGVGGLAALALPGFVRASAPRPTWFTHEELGRIFDWVDGQTTRETVDLDDPRFWNDKRLEQHEVVSLAIMRMANIMHRMTLDQKSTHWMVMSPGTASRDIWHPAVFCEYTTPGRRGGEWVRKPWRRFNQAEVSPGVYRLGSFNGRWQMYVDERFPENKLMLGMGYRTVVRFRREGVVRDDWGEYPKLVPYEGRPTLRNFAVITLKGG
jgi:hypothetical protein